MALSDMGSTLDQGMGGVAECHQSMYWMLLFFAKHGPQDRYSTHALSLVCAARTHPAIHAAMVGNMHRTCIEIQTATRHSFAILPRVRSCFGCTYIMIKLLQEVYCDGSNVTRRWMTVWSNTMITDDAGQPLLDKHSRETGNETRTTLVRNL